MAGNGDLRDRTVAADLEDRLAHDDRLQGCAVETAVRGGVAHLSGNVTSAEQRELVRATAVRTRGVQAVWDVLPAPGEPPPRIVDLGCGTTKQRDGALGIDRHPLSGVDIVADLECGLPFCSGSVDQVFAVHVLEHVHRLVPLMDEIHRVLAPSGVLHVMVPNWQFVNAVADPTHVRFFSAQTFKAFCRPGLGRLFWPLAIATSQDNIFADLQPIPPASRPPQRTSSFASSTDSRPGRAGVLIRCLHCPHGAGGLQPRAPTDLGPCSRCSYAARTHKSTSSGQTGFLCLVSAARSAGWWGYQIRVCEGTGRFLS